MVPAGTRGRWVITLTVLLLTGLCISAPPIAAAQTVGRIAGTVVDAKTGEGLPGANVTVKGTYYGAHQGYNEIIIPFRRPSSRDSRD